MPCCFVYVECVFDTHLLSLKYVDCQTLIIIYFSPFISHKCSATYVVL